MPGICIKYFVSAPPPGPTSSNCRKGRSCNAATILRQIFSSFRKCWPRDFFRVYIGAKVGNSEWLVASGEWRVGGGLIVSIPSSIPSVSLHWRVASGEWEEASPCRSLRPFHPCHYI